MEEAEKIVTKTLQKSMERREVRLGFKTIEDVSGVIVEALKDAGLLRIPTEAVEPSEEDVNRVAKAIEAAGFAWIRERDPQMVRTGFADVPEEVFARAAIIEFVNPSVEADKGAKP